MAQKKTKAVKRYPENWRKFTEDDLRELLVAQPQFAEKCDLNTFDDEAWVEMVQKCPGLINYRGVDKISGKYIGRLFEQMPELIEKCDFSEFGCESWAKLLVVKPEFAKKCDFSIFQDEGHAGYLAETIAAHAEFVQYLKEGYLKSLGRDAIVKICSKQPQLAEKFDLSVLFSSDWVQILEKQPQLLKKCSGVDFGDSDWLELIKTWPEFVDKIDAKSIEDEYGEVAEVIVEHPDLSKKFDLKKLGSTGIKVLLSKRPEFVDSVDLARLKGKDMASVLRYQPSLAKKLDLTVMERDCSGPGFASCWEVLLCSIPALAKRFEKSGNIRQLNRLGWAHLLAEHPEMEEFFLRNSCCDEGAQAWSIFDGDCWASLLSVQPQFADKCDFKLLKKMSYNWPKLILAQPQFEDKCDWDSLAPDSWVTLLSKKPELVEKFETTKCKGKRAF